MRRLLVTLAACTLFAACSHGGGSVASAPVLPGNNGEAPPTATPLPSALPSATANPSPTQSPSATSTPFNAANVRISEQSIPVQPLYVATGGDGRVYFGFGANGTGSNLYRFERGGTVQTMPAPPPSGLDSGGGVYGISVTGPGRVFWLSAYLDSSFTPFVDVQCGGDGGSATLCEPSVDEPTSMVLDRFGTFWIAGLSFSGGGEIATSSNAIAGFDTSGVMQILNGPRQSVWGVLADFSRDPALYSVAQFGVSGKSINIVHDYRLPSGDSISSITIGGDGDFWFTDPQRNAIGHMDTRGTVKELPLRESNALPAPWFGQWQITTACDGSVWFTEPGPNKIARMNMTGKIFEFSLPALGAQPGPIAARPAVRHACVAPELWVGEEHAQRLAAISF